VEFRFLFVLFFISSVNREMQGHNPDASLLPSVGGAITPMSGGGMVGGVLDIKGNQTVLEVSLNDYKANPDLVSALKTLAPSHFNAPTIDLYFEQKATSPEDDRLLKEEILAKVLTPDFIDKADRTVESNKTGAITPTNMENVLAYLSSQQIDVSKIKCILHSGGLDIEILVPGTEESTPERGVRFANSTPS
jgi:hypothetical protein